jgi:HPt (histidine-containing phosphotransfer) domain-containing protein
MSLAHVCEGHHRAGDHPCPGPGLDPVLNPAALDELRDLEKQGDPGLLAEIIDTYLSSAPRLIADLHAAIEMNDSAALHDAAHKFKPSSALLGAMPLAETCRLLDAIGRGGSTAGARERLEELEAEFRVVRRTLEAERGTGTP